MVTSFLCELFQTVKSLLVRISITFLAQVCGRYMSGTWPIRCKTQTINTLIFIAYNQLLIAIDLHTERFFLMKLMPHYQLVV